VSAPAYRESSGTQTFRALCSRYAASSPYHLKQAAHPRGRIRAADGLLCGSAIPRRMPGIGRLAYMLECTRLRAASTVGPQRDDAHNPRARSGSIVSP
jgi:hypothetical protein